NWSRCDDGRSGRSGARTDSGSARAADRPAPGNGPAACRFQAAADATAHGHAARDPAPDDGPAAELPAAVGRAAAVSAAQEVAGFEVRLRLCWPPETGGRHDPHHARGPDWT